MDIANPPTQLNADFDCYSYFQDAAFSSPVVSGQAFCRDVARSATAQYAMPADTMPERYLQQSAVPFHNPFDDPRFEKRTIVIVNSHLPYLPVRIEQQTTDHAPTYIPANECFSIQSILGIGSSAESARSRDKVPDASATLTVKRNGKCCKDPAEAERQKERKRAHQREHYRNDPVFAQRKRERQREFYKNNPNYAQKQRTRKRSAAYLAIERERYRERCKDPAFAEKQRLRFRNYQRERYRNNPEYAEYRKRIQRERYKRKRSQAHKKEALS
ncbi:hypothetical protein [Endozoicomonas sp. GU-1]|uniref:hypothetical protein n=1 Tax=Endozoicomonas sp. GU-1 TaxID=3009078 RepID=UPI0022B51A21|nr:hypothetical protein [Endozoicomonas sp. GU-1]WBA79519.1 hypothetical protein O2T12_14135 [Endozoicomonas sp. GU-1]WBA87163.1 hypothetical protein O3276_03710 [Endozoicomonas sp. GU-1]